MKAQLIITLILLCTYSCQNKPDSDKELELREREISLRERELAIEKNRNNESEEMNNSNSGNLGRGTHKSENDLRQDLSQTEGRNPKNYLSVEYDLTYKVFSGEDKISGNIYNSATLATFKDVVLSVTYSSATDAYLGSKNYIVYDYIYPGSSVPFTIKTYSPNGTKKIGVKIQSAKKD